MYLQKINIINYKNIEQKELSFGNGVSCFVGANGIGKTSILDAIYHLCFAKSYNNPTNAQNIKHGTDFFMLEGSFVKGEKYDTVLCSLKKGQKKTLKKNGKPYEKISLHIGQFPTVMIAPTDRDLILLGSMTRRKFMDGVISQQDPTYLQTLLDYQKVLAQRNALLKFFAKNNAFDAVSLEAYDFQIADYGTKIHQTRCDFINRFEPIFRGVYHKISEGKESVTLDYESALYQHSFEHLLQEQLKKDRLLQHTSQGIHRDDLSFCIEGYPIARFGSQGQQKTYLIALKLAQLSFLKQALGETPLLLLDDIFDKLDEQRVSQLLKMVNGDDFHQIFITDTHPERTKKLIENLTENSSVIEM